jgi:CRP/FNR family transcriptional regulator
MNYSLNNEIKITHQNLANKLGTTRVVISRILKKMENKRIIKLNRGEIQLL